jgi:hypothetical protein
MQSANLSICQSTPSLSQLRLVPKVGQMGSTMFKGGLITKYYNLNKLNYSHKLRITTTYKRIKDVTIITQDTNGYKNT